MSSRITSHVAMGFNVREDTEQSEVEGMCRMGDDGCPLDVPSEEEVEANSRDFYVKLLRDYFQRKGGRPS